MIMKLKQFGRLLTMTIILASSIDMSTNAYAQESGKLLEWKIGTSKQVFYPGEPVLLTLNIKNSGTQEEKVNFGMEGIGAFSMEIRDSNNIIITKGSKIERFGFTTRSSFLDVPPSKIVQKPIVLNRWCSTLLPPGKYHIICNVEYRLFSEDQKQPGTIVFKAGPIHKLQLELDIQIVELDKMEFEKIIESLVALEVKPESQSTGEWLEERDRAREMLALTESELAVPYQLKLLRTDPDTWFRPDAINSLVKSGTLEATTGLMQIIEDPSCKEDVKHVLIDGVYRLRETGKPDILSATNEFVAKHKRPFVDHPAVD